jgi:hypothetical protein
VYLQISVVYSDDPSYAVVEDQFVYFSSLDDPDDVGALETAALIWSNTSAHKLNGKPMTSEEGYEVYVSIHLTYPPQAMVQLELVSTRSDEAIPSPNVLYFTSDNYNESQTVTVTGLDDGLDESHQPFELVILPPVTSDPYYKENLGTYRVHMVNRASLYSRLYVEVINPNTSCNPVERGHTCNLSVSLQQLLAGEYVKPVDYKDLFEEGVAYVTVTLVASVPSQLAFVAQDTNTQTVATGQVEVTFNALSFEHSRPFTSNVSVTAVVDGKVNGDVFVSVNVSAVEVYEDVTYHIARSHLRYSPLNFTTIDTDSTYAVVDKTACNGTVNLDELGTRNCTFGFALAFAPSSSVEVELSVSDASRAAFVTSSDSSASGRRLTTSDSSSVTLTFTVDNYSTSQFITVIGIDDGVWDGDVYTGAATPVVINTTRVVTDDSFYSGLAGFTVEFTSDDNQAYGTSVATPLSYAD